MDSRIFVVICGESLYLMAIEARLADYEPIQVVRFDPYLPDAAARVASLHPAAVLVERQGDRFHLIDDLLALNIPVVEVRPGEPLARLHDGRRIEVTELEDWIVQMTSNAGQGER